MHSDPALQHVEILFPRVLYQLGELRDRTVIEAGNDRDHSLPGEIGELRIRSPQLMLAYTDPVVTAAQIDEDGWFYPGDIGSVDAEGWLKISGRSKDIINRGGEKFSAQEIEIAIMGYPGVGMAAVVGAPHQRLGEVVAAFVKMREGVAWLHVFDFGIPANRSVSEGIGVSRIRLLFVPLLGGLLLCLAIVAAPRSGQGTGEDDRHNRGVHSKGPPTRTPNKKRRSP